MALEIVTKEYATGAEGFAALVADLKTMLDWSEVDEGDGTKAIFKMYNSTDGSHWAGLCVILQASNCPIVNPVSNAGVQDYTVSVAPSSFYFRYINFVKWNGGFSAHATYNSALPCTNANFVNFGMAKGKFETSQNWCSWGVAINRIFIGSDDTNSTAAGGYSLIYAGKLTDAAPTIYPYSRYVIGDVLRINMTQETYMNTAGYCTWNGRRHYKNGCMLIPAE